MVTSLCSLTVFEHEFVHTEYFVFKDPLILIFHEQPFTSWNKVYTSSETKTWTSFETPGPFTLLLHRNIYGYLTFLSTGEQLCRGLWQGRMHCHSVFHPLLITLFPRLPSVVAGPSCDLRWGHWSQLGLALGSHGLASQRSSAALGQHLVTNTHCSHFLSTPCIVLPALSSRVHFLSNWYMSHRLCATSWTIKVTSWWVAKPHFACSALIVHQLAVLTRFASGCCQVSCFCVCLLLSLYSQFGNALSKILWLKIVSYTRLLAS